MSDSENTSNESQSFESPQSSALLNLSDIDSIVSLPGFQSTSEVYDLSGNSSNEMVNPNSQANAGSSTDSDSFQDTSQSRSSPPTTSQNSSNSPSTNANDLVLQESLDDSNLAAEIDRIRRFCENVENNLASIGLSSASTPRIVRGNRPRLNTTEPIEIIDLSEHYEAARQLARNRPPDAIIDLCTPVATRSTPSRGTAQRRRLEVPDPDCIIDNPSPPKRTCDSANNSQQDNSYRCPVCLESASQREPTSTKCGHVFCKVCIQSAIQSSHKCPICNKKLTARQTFRIYL
ncbi:uncharacterized protein Dwil_GK14441 [Drosophila willistoni]|uniref:RING-type domain-containing protein n=1 Tax=Drosophila willistoni TaxID=7260 RepID=B4NJT6_DROWI|nr:uncharacterized protein LOC6650102 [Drosophila willistoni]EDW85048.2 uncharacterized protein Dwil_GK14441 [Drosophila willistoni]